MSAVDTAPVAPELTTSSPDLVPSFHLTYRGDQAGLVGRVLGPNPHGEFWGVVTCDYDDASNRSKVGIVHLTGPEIHNAVVALADGEHPTAPPGVHQHVPPALAFCRLCSIYAGAADELGIAARQ